ncbi:MAG: Clp protease N-terminal domain-containing protein [Chitinophagaceae bacterium]
MNLNNFKIGKAQEAIQAAQQSAYNNQSPNIESGHLLEALLNDDNGAVSFLLKKNNVNLTHLQSKEAAADRPICKSTGYSACTDDQPGI